MLRGAEYKNALEGARRGEDRITLGIGESLKLIDNLSRFSDPVKVKETKKTEHQQMMESWNP